MIFKDYLQRPMFIPLPQYDDLFPKMSIQRIIDNFVDRLDLKDIEETYKPGGAPCYHPRVLLKVILYSYSRNIYGCRPIADMCRSDMICLWYTNFKNPSFSTINRFRSEHMGLERTLDVFRRLVEILVDDGLVSFEECTYLDGTTIESRASRTKLVWVQTQRRFAESNKAKIYELLATAGMAQSQDSAAEDESPVAPEPHDDGQAQSSEPETKHDKPDAQAQSSEPETKHDGPDGQNKPEDERPKKKKKRDRSVHMSPEELTKIKADLATGKLKLTPGRRRELEERLEKAERYLDRDDLCGDKSGTALTDPDSIAMHPKDDVRQTGPCLPMYNLQLQTQHQFILNLALFGTANDMSAFPLFLSLIPEGQRSATMAADAGYGSLENYKIAMDAGIVPFFKYNTYDKECRPNYKPDPFKAENMPELENGSLKCPGGELRKIRERTQEKNGVAFTEVFYYTDQCATCEFRLKCRGKQQKDYREVKRRKEWYEMKPEIKKLLDSPQGQTELRERSKDVEPTFAHTKWAGAYKRFRHFGIDSCRMDLLIRAIAHNLKKYVRRLKDEIRQNQGTDGGHTPKAGKPQNGHISAIPGLYGLFCRIIITIGQFRKNRPRSVRIALSA